jgi:hypothetical protein
VIESWKNEGFQIELDHYLAQHLIDRATNPKDKAYLFQLAEKFGFFKSPGWETNPNYASVFSGKFIFARPALDKPNRAEPATVVPAKDVIRSLWGEIPNRTTWPDETVTQQVASQSTAAEWIALQVKMEEMKGRIATFGAPPEDENTATPDV